MANEKPIGELAPSVSRAFDGKEDLRDPPCRACGSRTHGGVGSLVKCLEREIDRLRAAVTRMAGKAP